MGAMKESLSTQRTEPVPVSREDFELFLQALTHEIRNRLSGISLEAADLAEQAGPEIDSSRLQQQVQDCSTFLRKVREIAALDGAEAGKLALADVTKKLKDRSL
jgi:signal transduction histidine kinase